MKRLIIIAVLLLLVLYADDYLVLQYKMAKNTGVSNVTVQQYYAVKQKDGTTQFMFTDPQTQSCVHSWFPHLGYTPCWYLNRHRTRRIDM